MVIFGPPFGQVPKQDLAMFDTPDVQFGHRGVKSRAPALKPHDAHMCKQGFKTEIHEGARTMDPIWGSKLAHGHPPEVPNPDMDLI